MPVASRSGTLTTLQAAAATAINGISLDISGGSNLLIEASGTFTGMTAVPEISLDGGTTWGIVSVETLSSLTLARVAAIVAVGQYRLTDISGATHFRARTTGTGGPLTIKAAVGVS
jgi:hypothetical protein